MTDTAAPPPQSPVLRQPAPWLRWTAVVLAAAGWYVSLELARVSARGQHDSPFMNAVCGNHTNDSGCTAVLTSPQAYLTTGNQPGGVKLPVSVLGMGYFLFVALWYLFVGPPTRDRRMWHWIILATVIWGAWESINYIQVMAFELHRWCGGCLVAHAINGALLIVTLLAWPRRNIPQTSASHPTPRLALSTLTAGGLGFLLHLAVIYVIIAGNILRTERARYADLLYDPEFVTWDYRRQPEFDIALREDEFLAGDPNAPHTAFVFSDFQCPSCRELHVTLERVLANHPDDLRIAYRYYPQDPACNPNPDYHAGGHASGCIAARAAEAVRHIAGDRAYRQMCDLLYTRQRELPHLSGDAAQKRARTLIAEWVNEIGIDRAAFLSALDDPTITQRLDADISQAHELGLSAMPVVILDRRRLRGWTRMETWDVLLSPTAATQPVDDRNE